MTPESHQALADAHQADIYRRMRPEERLAQGVRMNQTMRRLMDAGLRVEHPDWTEDQRRREIARRILHATTA